MCVISLSWTVVVVEVLLTWARDEIVGSEGLGQHFLTTAWLTKPTGIYFHKQGREMFFIPNCLQVLLFSLSSLELEKHANTESASNRNTRRAPALTQAACSGRQRMHDPCLSHLCTTLLAHVFMCMHLSRHFCCFFLNSDHLDFSLMYSCLYTWVMTRLCAAEIALPWGYWVCFWEGDFRMRLKGLYYVEYA